MFGFNQYSDNKSVPAAGEGKRVAVVRYKNTKKQKAAFSNIWVQVPAVAVPADKFQMFATHINTMIESAQDGIIKDLHESGKSLVSDSQLSLDACLQFLNDAAESDRLKKEDVIEWFNSELQETLTLAIADKLGVSDTPTKEEETRIAASIDIYRAKFASLAGGKTYYSPEVANKLIAVLAMVPADEISVKFNTRLTKMAQESAADLMAL